MTEQERQDLEVLNAAVVKEKLNLYGMMETCNRADETTLKHLGCNGKTQGEAMQLFFQMTKKKIEGMLNAHTRKYPD